MEGGNRLDKFLMFKQKEEKILQFHADPGGKNVRINPGCAFKILTWKV